jgi:hypothetical protein
VREPALPAAPPTPAREFFPGAESDLDDGAAMERPMPIPDEQQLEGMFDDLRDRNTPFAAEPKPSLPKVETPTAVPPKAAAPGASAPRGAAHGPAASGLTAPVSPTRMTAAPSPMLDEPVMNEEIAESTEALLNADLDRLGDAAPPRTRPRRPAASAFNPEQAYLEAVSFDDDQPLKPPRPPRGTVPEDQKYRFFLKPGAFSGETTEETAAGQAPAAPAAPPRPLPKSPPIPPPRDAATAPGALQVMDDEIAPPPRGMADAFLGAMDAALGDGMVDASFDSLELDTLAGQLEPDSPLDDVDALLKDEGLDATPLPGLPRIPPEPMHRAGAGGMAWGRGAARMEGMRDQAIAAGLIVLAGGVLALLFWLGFRLA